MHGWTRAALVTSLALASTASAGPDLYTRVYEAPWIAPYPAPYAYPVVPGYAWQGPVPYGVPQVPAWYGYDPGYRYRMQPGFEFHQPEGRRGFSIKGFTLPGGR